MDKLEALNCIEITSQTQANNGTQCFHDPITETDYLSYESGYIRRAYTRTHYLTGRKTRSIYQLNPQHKGIYISKYSGIKHNCTERVMIESSQERLNSLAKAVVNYRNYSNS